MCSRYYIDFDMADEIQKVVHDVDRRIRQDHFRGDIRPTDVAPVIEQSDLGLKMNISRWGYPLSKGKSMVINARVESVLDKPAFGEGIRYHGRGGKIVFGIDDKTLEIVGMDVDNIYKTMDAITNAISDSCEPAIRPDVAMQTVKDKTVIVVEVFPGAERPYYIKSQGMFKGTDKMQIMHNHCHHLP